jgi:hypothetical protein
LKKKNNFLIGNWLREEFSAAQPASPRAHAYVAQPAGIAAQWIRIADPNLIRLRQIRPDRRLTQHKPVIKPIKPIVQNRVYPLPDFFRIFAR